MFNTWRKKYYELESQNKSSHPVAKIPWSVIRRIGQSKLVALTIIVPLLGSLLLFIQYVVDVLTLSPELVKRWTGASADVQSEARQLTFARLYFVYFGLSLLGIGSGLFALFCPLDIENHGSAREYLEAESPLVTKARMGLIVPNIARHFQFWSGEDEFEKHKRTRALGEPDEFISLFAVVMTELYIAMPPDDPPRTRLCPPKVRR